jgi:predicted ATPase
VWPSYLLAPSRFCSRDVEGSTRLLLELGDRYAEVLAEHRRLLRKASARHGGVEVDTQGDAFFVAFAKASDALAAASEAQEDFGDGPVRVRMGLHTGEPLVTDEGYVGVDVHRAARIMSAAHGGQVLVSEQTYALLNGGDVLTDLGLHRLKDMREPEKLFQLGDDEFPPLKTLDATNLPVAASALLGRERELTELQDLVNHHRLVTVTGPGGTGKTRLALQIAAELVGSFKDGVFWVPLADLADSQLVVPSIAQTLGCRVELKEFLRGKDLLLLLDNFEHLPAAAPAVAELLAATKGLRLIVTSRTPLHLSGEQEYPLEPLPADDAVTLFLERARGAGRTLARDQTVEAICRRLDCLPLAIELAAARTRLLTPESLLERLDHSLALLTGGMRDAPERQRTLRATIEWSHALLDDRGRDLFACLAVFAGSFSLRAATSICSPDIDVLQNLVEASLVKPLGEDRYLMLETIREYAAERLDARDDAIEVRRKHADFFTRLAEETLPQLTRDAVRLALAEDVPNFRSALVFWDENQESEPMLRLAAALAFYWGESQDGRRWLEQALQAAPNRVRARARGLRGLAHMYGNLDDSVRAGAYLREALAIYRELDDEDGIARCLNNLGLNAWRQGDADAAGPLFEQSLAIGRGPVPLENLARLALERGELVKARALLEETLGLARETEDEHILPAVQRELAYLAALEDGCDVAARAMHELLRSGRDRREPWLWNSEENVLLTAFLTWKRGNDADAARLVRAVIAERQRRGLPAWSRPRCPYIEPLVRGLEENGHDPSS